MQQQHRLAAPATLVRHVEGGPVGRLDADDGGGDGHGRLRGEDGGHGGSCGSGRRGGGDCA
ncbi:hypothetical protein [Streptomyces axinellae]|uniref:hypothetical protein n=1 Tax=Streptomyces axinellae TaxID=552788 RepID=UPI0031D12BAE